MSQQWKPDVHAREYVPEAFTAINQSTATPIPAPEITKIDFERYAATFAGSSFRTPLLDPAWPQPEAEPGLSPAAIEPSTYGQYFEVSLASDIEAHVAELRDYDLFGVPLHVIDQTQQIYSLQVPGLRDGMPTANFGDLIFLRQLILDPTTGLPANMEPYLVASTNHKMVHPAPGFTGYQINATIWGVDNQNERILIRANFVLNTLPLLFNVVFPIQARTVKSFQRATATIATVLTNQASILGSGPAQSDESPGENDSKRWLRHMLFPREENGIIQSTLPSSLLDRTWYDQMLNYEQKKAVDAIQSRNYGDLPFLVNGPPGTGKTKTICETVVQLANHPSFVGNILLCAPSNPAADTLAERLKPYFSLKSMLRLNDYSRTFAEVPLSLLPYCYVENDIFNIPPIAQLMAYRIVVTTCRDADILIQARVTNSDLAALQKNIAMTFSPFQQQKQAQVPSHWEALMIDEAAQATEPEILIPLSVINPHALWTSSTSTPIFVMAGDEHQLNPRTHGGRPSRLSMSLFERLSKTSVYASHPYARKTMYGKNPRSRMIRPPFVNLTRNYRSHPAILAVPSSLFYSNTLIPDATRTDSLLSWTGWRQAVRAGWPVLFYCNSGIDDCKNVRGIGGGWYNTNEAKKAMDIAYSLLKSRLIIDQREICVMSPFPAQVRYLRQRAKNRGLGLVNIGPVEAFQGLESRFVIICTTRARKRFLEADQAKGVGIVQEKKKFNVAITRAKEGLIVIGNPWILSTDEYWLSFLTFCWRNSLWVKDNSNDPRMTELGEAAANSWSPTTRSDGEGAENMFKEKQIAGLEAALLYREREKLHGSEAAKRFMGQSNGEDDIMWASGIEAEKMIAEVHLSTNEGSPQPEDLANDANSGGDSEHST